MDENLFKEKKYNKDYSKYEKKDKQKSNSTSKRNKINIWKDTVEKKKLELEETKVRDDVVIYFYDKLLSEDIPADIRQKLIKLIDAIKDKGYNVRIMCINANPILKLLEAKLDKKRINVVKPWEKFCDVKDYRTWLPSDVNIQLAAEYADNFDKLPAAIKSFKSALVTLLTSYTGKDLAKAVFIYDPHYAETGKLDFTKSKDTYDLVRIAKNMGTFAIYNIAKDEEFKTGLEQLEKK